MSAPAPAPSPAPAAARPTGITILAILAGLAGALGLLAGFALLFAGTVLFGGLGALLGIAVLAYAALFVSFAYGAWTLKPWAWPLGVAVTVYGIILQVITIVGGGNIVSSGIGIVLDGVILYYLNQPHIKAVFGRA